MGLTVWALRERIWAGLIPVVQFPGGRKQYIDAVDIENFIKKNKRVIDKLPAKMKKNNSLPASVK
jgi:hypothetical protein